MVLSQKQSILQISFVPYSLGRTALTYLLTRNTAKALSILMVDFSCALKLAMPIIAICSNKTGKSGECNSQALSS